MNNILNEYGSQLDLVFTSNNSTNILPSDDSLVPIDRYHPPLFIKNNAMKIVIINECSNTCFYNYKYIHFSIMNNMLANVDWSNMYLKNDINISLNIFYKEILSIIDVLAKKIYIKKCKFPIWFSSELRSLIIEKKKVHKVFK